MVIGDRFADVLRAAQAGDPSAFEDLYRDLAPLVLGYLRARGARDAEDVAADTFVAVVRNISRFRGGEARLRSWVLTIAHRKLVDARRRSGRRPEDLGADGAERAVAPDDTEALALDRVGSGRMDDLLAGLTDEQRAVLMLRVVADLSVAETARVMRKRPGAVKTLHRRALERLNRLISAGDPFPPRGRER